MALKNTKKGPKPKDKGKKKSKTLKVSKPFSKSVTFNSDVAVKEFGTAPEESSPIKSEISDEQIKDVLPKKPESKRQKKRAKRDQQVLETKVKTKFAAQEKALNYLSKWKYDRGGWKFEKLRQVWLSQHVYDSAKIPDKMYTVLVEYFSSAKGQARKAILDGATKVIEEAENAEEPPVDDVKFQRARTLIQSLA